MSLRQNFKQVPSYFLVLKSSPFCIRSSFSTEVQVQKDPYALLKEDPIQICASIWVKSFSAPRNSTFPKLTGFLSKLDLWVLAYQRSYAYVTGTFPPRSAIHFNTLNSIISLREAVVYNRFRWNDRTHLVLRGPNDPPLNSVISKTKLRAMLNSSDPCFQDRVVQEVLLMILEPLFEARFSSRSHAFRPGRNAHTVIRTIRNSFAGYLWFLRVDLSEIFWRVDASIVMGCVEKVVEDRRVLNLIRTGLTTKAHRVENMSDDEEVCRRKKKRKATKKRILKQNEPKPDPYWLRTFFGFAPEEASSVPEYGHCGILSPLLSNICLNELDQMMEARIVQFFRPNKLDSIWRDSIDDGCHNPSWPEFVPSSGKEKTRKMDYIRYGSYFLIGIRGPRDEAVQIRREIIDFCDTNLGIRLDNSKVEIEHISRGVQFLDHIICRRVIYPTLRYTGSGGKVVSEKGVGTLLSVTASLPLCIRRFRRLQLVKGDRNPEPLPCIPMLYSGQAHTNSQMNKFLETMADWFRYADNRKKIVGFCAFVIRSSVAKLYAARYRLHSRAKVYRLASRNLSKPLRESSNNSAPEYCDLLRMGAVDSIEGIHFSQMNLIPSCDYSPLPRFWLPDHELLLREYIKLDDPMFFCKLHASIKNQRPSLPQDEISQIVWDYKTLGVWRYLPASGKEDSSINSATLKEKVSLLGAQQ